MSGDIGVNEYKSEKYKIENDYEDYKMTCRRHEI